MKNMLQLVLACVIFPLIFAEEGYFTIPLQTKIGRTVVNYGKDIISSEKIMTTSTGVANEDLINVHSSYYIGMISIGTPPQNLTVQFDTGSNVMWVLPAAFCRTNVTKCAIHKSYDHCWSRTYQKDGRSFKIEYGTGYAKGTFSRDVFSVGPLKAEGQTFGEVYDVANLFLLDQGDGIFPLGFVPEPFNDGTYIAPPLVSLVNQKVLKEPIFAFYLTKLDSGKTSELTIGAVDHTKYKGKFAYTPVISQKNWVINVARVTIGNKKFGGPFTTVPDSGSSGFAFPKGMFNSFVKATGATYDSDHDLYAVSCDRINRLPTIKIFIGKQAFWMKSKEYAIKFHTKSGEVCWIGAVTLGEFVILGSTFLQKYYTVYDIGELRIGFAPAV